MKLIIHALILKHSIELKNTFVLLRKLYLLIHQYKTHSERIKSRMDWTADTLTADVEELLNALTPESGHYIHKITAAQFTNNNT